MGKCAWQRCGCKAAANNNTVTITGGVVNNSVYGAYLQGMHTAQFNADNNIVSISGDAKVNGKIYAAYISVSDSENSAAAVSEKADNNMVIVSGNADISNAALHGIGSGGKISGSGNTLVINGWHGSVKPWTVLIMWCLRKLPGRITAKC